MLDRRRFLILSLCAPLGACGEKDALPDVPLHLLDAAPTRLAALRGQPVLLTFWATSCPACIEEIPLLLDLHNTYGPRGLKVIGVAMSHDPEPQVRALRERMALPYLIALDRDGAVSEALGKVRLTPTTFLLDPKGRVVYQKIGLFDLAKVKGLIEGMLQG